MKHASTLIGSAWALLASLAVVGSGSPARAAELPAYWQMIVGTSTSSAGQVASKNILQLNTSMFELYTDAGLTFRKNILAQHPVILALFSGAADGSFSTGPAWRRSMRRRCQPSTNYSSPSPTALWRWPWWSVPI